MPAWRLKSQWLGQARCKEAASKAAEEAAIRAERAQHVNNKRLKRDHQATQNSLALYKGQIKDLQGKRSQCQLQHDQQLM